MKASISSRSVLVCLSFLLIISVSVLTAESREQIKIPEYRKQILLNGMEFLFLPTTAKELPFAMMTVNGAAFDPIDKWGATAVTCHMLVDRSRDPRGQLLTERLTQIGAKINLHVDWDGIFLTGTAPADSISEVLDILARMMTEPDFKEEDFEQVRDQLLKEVTEKQQRPDWDSESIFRAEVFKGNPYEHSVKGNSETLKNLTLTDIKIQYKKLFLPNQTQLALYYPGDVNELFASLSRSWGSWIRRDPAPFTFRQADTLKSKRILLIDRPAENSLFRWGALGVPIGAAESYPMEVLEQYLTLSLPSWASQVASSNQIRAGVKLFMRKMPGYLQLSIQAPPDQLASYFKLLMADLENIKSGKIDADRFEEARRVAFAEFSKPFRDPQSQLLQLLKIRLYDLGISYIFNYDLRLQRVTPRNLQDLVGTVLSPTASMTVLVGPGATLQPLFSQFGQVEILN